MNAAEVTFQTGISKLLMQLDGEALVLCGMRLSNSRTIRTVSRDSRRFAIFQSLKFDRPANTCQILTMAYVSSRQYSNGSCSICCFRAGRILMNSFEKSLHRHSAVFHSI